MRDSSPCWQKILANGFSAASELLHFLELPLSMGSPLAETQFKTRVPRAFAARMQKKNPYDPLLLQVLATPTELETPVSFVMDPVGDLPANTLEGLIHKYHGRVLLTLTGACAVNCRFCFRRHFPYDQNNPGRAGWQSVLAYIENDTSIHEVIFSGGDPLLATDSLLGMFLTALQRIPHIRSIRFHTRIPVVLPERINASFLALMADSPLRKIMVLHCNHPNELDNTVQLACELLRKAGFQLLNQSVLLAGINNEIAILTALSEQLFDIGVLPYYLHLLDKVQGASSFDVPLEEALGLFHGMQSQLPGYLIPRLVREEAGKRHKTLLV